MFAYVLNRRNCFVERFLDGQSCWNFGKKQKGKASKSNTRLLHFSSLSDTLFPSKNWWSFQPAQLNTQTNTQISPRCSTTIKDIARTGQATSKTGSYADSWTHDIGPKSRAGRPRTRAGVLRGRGRFGCSLPHFHVMS